MLLTTDREQLEPRSLVTRTALQSVQSTSSAFSTALRHVNHLVQRASDFLLAANTNTERVVVVPIQSSRGRLHVTVKPRHPPVFIVSTQYQRATDRQTDRRTDVASKQTWRLVTMSASLYTSL